MSNYKSYDQTIIEDISEAKVESMYSKGYVFTRLAKGVMEQIRSMRIKLSGFEFNSENRRILRKTEILNIKTINLPIPLENYDYHIHKIGKDFYKARNNGEDVFSASKIRELVVDESKSNFNVLLKFTHIETKEIIGYAICHETENILHYAYPFYNLSIDYKNLGMGMILSAISYKLKATLNVQSADRPIKSNLKYNPQTSNLEYKSYFYLGSLHDEKSKYKLQFNNIEWWDGDYWSKDVEKVKKLLK